MTQKRNVKRAKTPEVPMVADQYILLDNVPDRDEPKELVELRKRAPHYITALKGRANPRSAALKQVVAILGKSKQEIALSKDNSGER